MVVVVVAVALPMGPNGLWPLAGFFLCGISCIAESVSFDTFPAIYMTPFVCGSKAGIFEIFGNGVCIVASRHGGC